MIAPVPVGWDIYWAALRLTAFLCAAGVVGTAIIAILMAFALLCPSRMNEAKALYYLRRLTPEDINLPYESIYFMVKDLASRSQTKIRLTAWWIPHPEPVSQCAIILHGYGDAKVGGIAWAPLMRSLGFHVLAVDLRAHGQSQGRYTTAGFYERHDLTQIIDQLKSQYPAQTRQIVMLGDSLGAAVACATAMLRNDIAAIILDCPYVDFPSAVLSHADNLGVPGRTFQRFALWLCRHIARVDYSKVRPVDLIPQVPCALWVIQSSDDPFVRLDDQRLIAQAVAKRTDNLSGHWHVADCHHVIALAEHPEEYRQVVSEFLSKALGAKTRS
jgi:pimeloyl-ACP methyl ester carboxylesterase